jgi:hypothetical protein
LRRFITHYGLEQYGFCRPTVTAIFHELKWLCSSFRIAYNGVWSIYSNRHAFAW